MQIRRATPFTLVNCLVHDRLRRVPCRWRNLARYFVRKLAFQNDCRKTETAVDISENKYSQHGCLKVISAVVWLRISKDTGRRWAEGQISFKLKAPHKGVLLNLKVIPVPCGSLIDGLPMVTPGNNAPGHSGGARIALVSYFMRILADNVSVKLVRFLRVFFFSFQ